MRVRSLSHVALVLIAAACSSDEEGSTAPPAVTLASVTVSPAAMSLQAGQQQTIVAQGIGSNGQTVSGTTFTYESSNAAIAVASTTGAVTALNAGSATITVTGTAGGLSRTASVNVSVTGTLPTTGTVVAGANSNVFQPAFLAIARGGTVTFTFPGIVHNVNFQGAAGAPANIPNTSNNAAGVARTFTAAGTFNYVCTLHTGMVGTILVP